MSHLRDPLDRSTCKCSVWYHLIYHLAAPCFMHLAEPRLLWRVKRLDGTWKYEPAKWVMIEQVGPNVMAMISLPVPPITGVDESE